MVNLEKTLYDLCEPLVEDSGSLSVEEMSSSNDNEILLYVYAKSTDVARLIGRKGIMAASIRAMMTIANRDSKKHIAVKFEPY